MIPYCGFHSTTLSRCTAMRKRAAHSLPKACVFSISWHSTEENPHEFLERTWLGIEKTAIPL